MKISPDLVFFITGGASGLGEAAGRLLHSNGCRVAVADFNEEKLELLRKDLKERILCIKCDVTKEEDVKNAVDKTVKEWGTIHAALACAGVATITPTLSSRGGLDTEVFRSVVNINLYGSVYVAKYASMQMSKNQPNERGERGVILFVSSVAAEEGQRGQVGYSATKGALNGMVLPMARDLGRYGIRVAAIAPGIFETPLSHLMTDAVRKRLVADTPMGRMG
jgi:NAD(P)-dependent dehydrogenase (short-subunit alcohol dehydrogenase family)